jgi:predicted RNA-binding protein associated with RNAse of E/G family
MATVADQDSLQSAVKLVQITREAIKYLEAAQKVTDVLVSF